jgi:Ca-activated chloride channel family protein
VASGLGAQSARAEPLNAYLENEKGLKDFQAGKVEEAKKEFGSAQAVVPDAPELLFNEGVVQLQQGDAEAASQSFQGALTRSIGKNPKLAGKAMFNLGEALTKKGDFKNAARAYANAISQAQALKDPRLEADARKNIELLVQEKQKQQQQKQDQKKDQQQKKDDQQKQDQKKDQDKDQDKDKDKKDQDKKDQDKKDQQKPDQKDQDKDKDKDKKEDPGKYKDEEKQKFSSQKLRPEDADRVMEELRHQERELEAKLKKKNAQNQTAVHDW